MNTLNKKLLIGLGLIAVTTINLLNAYILIFG